MRLVLLRHAEAEGNAEGRMLGRTDVPLTAAGRAATRRLALALGSSPPDRLLVSPLARARETAEILCSAAGWSGTAIAIEPDLQEIDDGVLSGLTWAEAGQHYPDLCRTLETALLWWPIPGAETPTQLRQRAEAVRERALAEPVETLWLVSHGGFLQYLLAALLQTPQVWGLNLPCLGRIELEIDARHWRCGGEDAGNPTLRRLRGIYPPP